MNTVTDTIANALAYYTVIKITTVNVFYKIGSWGWIHNTIFFVTYGPNKLQCLKPASL
jgi:hypothetical protein